jgi:hypothetical protein
MDGAALCRGYLAVGEDVGQVEDELKSCDWIITEAGSKKELGLSGARRVDGRTQISLRSGILSSSVIK